MMQDLLQEMRKMVTEEEKNTPYSQAPSFSPSPLKSRKKRLSRRSRGNITPETRISKSSIGSEMKIMQEKIMENTKILVESETSKLKNEVGSFMIEVMKQLKKFKNSRGGEDLDEVFDEIDHLKSDNNQLVQHMKNFNTRVEKMEMRLFNYEMELGSVKNASEENTPKIENILKVINSRGDKIDNITKGYAGFFDKIEGIEEQIQKLGTDLDLVSDKGIQDLKKLGEFVVKHQKETLGRLENKISEVAFSSKYRGDSSHQSVKFDDENVLDVLENHGNRERIKKILFEIFDKEKEFEHHETKIKLLEQKIDDFNTDIKSQFTSDLEEKSKEIKNYIQSEIERVSQVVDQLGEEIEENGQDANYCSLSKFVLRDELDEIKNKLDEVISRKEESNIQSQNSTQADEALKPKINEIEDKLVILHKKVDILVDSKLDKNEADLFQSEFERIVRRLDELSLRIEITNKKNSNLENSYNTKEFHRSPKRKTTSGMSYQLSPDEANSHDFTDGKINQRMRDFRKQNDPTAVSVQSDQEGRRSIHINTENIINSSRENNFNSLEKTLKFNIEGSKSKISSKNSSIMKRGKLGVEELKLSYVYSNQKHEEMGYEDLDTPQDIEGIVSRRLFEKKDLPSDSARGSENNNHSSTFLGTLKEISNLESRKKFSSGFSGVEKLNSMSINSITDKENICNNVTTTKSENNGVIFRKNIAKEKAKKEKIKPKVIEPENEFDFEKWAQENSLNIV